MTAQVGALLDRREPPRQLAGSKEPDRIFELRSRGCSGVVTTATCKLPLVNTTLPWSSGDNIPSTRLRPRWTGLHTSAPRAAFWSLDRRGPRTPQASIGDGAAWFPGRDRHPLRERRRHFRRVGSMSVNPRWLR